MTCAAVCLGGDRALAGFVFSLPDDPQSVVSSAGRLDSVAIENPGPVCSACDQNGDSDSHAPMSSPTDSRYPFLSIVGQLLGDGGPLNGPQKDTGGSKLSESHLAPSSAASPLSPRAKSGRISLDRTLILFPPIASRYFRPPRRAGCSSGKPAGVIADRAAAWRASG